METLRSMSIAMINIDGKDKYYAPSFKRIVLTIVIGVIFDLSFPKIIIMKSKLE